MIKHTPGPWAMTPGRHLERACVWDSDSRAVATVMTDANARLIAAAPDLLKALDVALSFISDRAAKRVIVAAMAKARGETTDTVQGTSQHPTEGDG